MSSLYTDYSNVGTIPAGIQSTAGAVTVVNDKGKLVTEKVRVSRYISGKRPEYAPASSDEDDDHPNKEFVKVQRVHEYDQDTGVGASSVGVNAKLPNREVVDRRLQRLRNRPSYHQARHRGSSSSSSSDDEDAAARGHERRVASDGEPADRRDKSDDEIDAEIDDERRRRVSRHHRRAQLMQDSEDENEPRGADHGGRGGQYDGHTSESDQDGADCVLDEEAISARREMLRLKHQEKPEKELMEVEDEEVEGRAVDHDDSSEWEEYTDTSDDDNNGGDIADSSARLKPVFVRLRDRVTIQEKELAEQKARQLESLDKKNAENRRMETLKLVEVEVRKEMDESRVTGASALGDIASVIGDCERLDITTVDTADENEDEQVAYEEWKLRELKRIKRDRDQRDAMEKNKEEVNKLHNATEEERFKYFKQNPKEVVNKAHKGKYKFLQKFYHRGAFFLDEEDQVFTRDVTQPTLEDHFDKTVLPRVMQVKNFGRSGRTKYTHLVDQDTTEFDSPWSNDTSMSLKFQKKGQNCYEKPTMKKKNQK